jgi:hypothetical protein
MTKVGFQSVLADETNSGLQLLIDGADYTLINNGKRRELRRGVDTLFGQTLGFAEKSKQVTDGRPEGLLVLQPVITGVEAVSPLGLSRVRRL